jgi:hypothetical protein
VINQPRLIRLKTVESAARLRILIAQAMNRGRDFAAELHKPGRLAGIADRQNGAFAKEAAEGDKVAGLFAGHGNEAHGCGFDRQFPPLLVRIQKREFVSTYPHLQGADHGGKL